MTLPPQFTGEPATVGARLAAFTIDVTLVAVIGAAVWLVTGTAAFGALLAAEAVLALWILQSRTGVSPGKALLRLRVSRADAPFSPGAGPSFVRGSLVALGGLVFAAGAWVVQASAAWDRSGERRSWADQAAQTRVVLAPARPKDRRGPGRPAAGTDAALHAPEPTVVARPWRPAAVAPAWGAPQSVPQEPAASDRPEDATGALLLIFDTGQRERLSLRHAAVLGRNPEATEPNDVAIAVEDPDAGVSKDHLRLEYDRGGLWVTDLDSTNGTELIDDDGSVRPVPPGLRVRMDEDMRVRMGDRTFTVSRLMGAP